MDSIIVRDEQKSDYKSISNIHILNFKHDLEAVLIGNLRKESNFKPCYSRVITLNEKVVGHAMLTPVKVTNCTYETDALILGPVGVNKENQGLGLGTMLIKDAIRVAKENGFKMILVYGGDYYKRFGFKSSKTIFRPNPVKGHGILMKKLGRLPSKYMVGVIHYPHSFDPLIREWDK